MTDEEIIAVFDEKRHFKNGIFNFALFGQDVITKDLKHRQKYDTSVSSLTAPKKLPEDMLLTPEEIDKLVKEYPLLDFSFVDDYREESKILAEAQLAKVRMEYPIMFKEEAELDVWLVEHGWLPPAKAEELKETLKHRQKYDTSVSSLTAPKNNKELRDSFITYIAKMCPNLLNKKVVVLADQLLALYSDIEEIRKQERERIVKELEDAHRPDYGMRQVISYLKYRFGIPQ